MNTLLFIFGWILLAIIIEVIVEWFVPIMLTIKEIYDGPHEKL